LKILVIVAHPDDEVLGAGGVILKHIQSGDEVKIIIMATGIMARRKSGLKNETTYSIPNSELVKMKKEIESLKKDAIRAAKMLSVTDISFYNLPDNEMDSISLLKVVKIIESEIKNKKPDRIYTHHKHDLNIDHRIVFQACLTASRPINNKSIDLISFEVPSSTEWNYPNTFSPNYFVCINKQLSKKMKAMKCYKTELEKFPHTRSLEYIKINANRWGAISGNTSAEAFEIIRKIEK
jgi:LmbE family N-acetylglucosaminyl deacetylase